MFLFFTAAHSACLIERMKPELMDFLDFKFNRTDEANNGSVSAQINAD